MTEPASTSSHTDFSHSGITHSGASPDAASLDAAFGPDFPFRDLTDIELAGSRSRLWAEDVLRADELDAARRASGPAGSQTADEVGGGAVCEHCPHCQALAVTPDVDAGWVLQVEDVLSGGRDLWADYETVDEQPVRFRSEEAALRWHALEVEQRWRHRRDAYEAEQARVVRDRELRERRRAALESAGLWMQDHETVSPLTSVVRLPRVKPPAALSDTTYRAVRDQDAVRPLSAY